MIEVPVILVAIRVATLVHQSNFLGHLGKFRVTQVELFLVEVLSFIVAVELVPVIFRLERRKHKRTDTHVEQECNQNDNELAISVRGVERRLFVRRASVEVVTAALSRGVVAHVSTGSGEFTRHWSLVTSHDDGKCLRFQVSNLFSLSNKQAAAVDQSWASEDLRLYEACLCFGSRLFAAASSGFSACRKAKVKPSTQKGLVHS